MESILNSLPSDFKTLSAAFQMPALQDQVNTIILRLLESKSFGELRKFWKKQGGKDFQRHLDNAFYQSIQDQRMELAELLLANGANSNRNGICLSYAIKRELVDTVEFLLACGAEIYEYNECNAWKQNNCEILQLLTIYGASFKRFRYDKLSKALVAADVQSVKTLVARGAPFDFRGSSALLTAIYTARISGYQRHIQFRKGGDRRSIFGVTVRRAEKSTLDIVKLLLDNGADVHANGDLAIIEASRKGLFNLVKLLVKYGADIYAQSGQLFENLTDFRFDRPVIRRFLVEQTRIKPSPLLSYLESPQEKYGFEIDPVSVCEELLKRAAPFLNHEKNVAEAALATGQYKILAVLHSYGIEIEQREERYQKALIEGNEELAEILKEPALRQKFSRASDFDPCFN